MDELGSGAADALGRPAEFSSRGSTAAEVAQRRFGGPTTVRTSAVTVGTSSTQVLKNDPRRVFWAIFNLAVNSGNAGFGNDVSSSNGFPLQALGGSASMSVDEDGEAVSYPLFGVLANAAGSWFVVEVLRV